MAVNFEEKMLIADEYSILFHKHEGKFNNFIMAEW